LLIFLLALSFPSFGQFRTTFQFSIPEGMPSAEVYEVHQDKKGFLWFATDNGVARYDGKDFQVFQVKDGLTDPVVFGFLEDDEGRIWFRTFSGRACYFDGEKIISYPYNEELLRNGENGLFRYVYDSRSDELWFTLEYKLGKIDKQGKSRQLGHFKRSLFIHSVNGKYLLGGDTQYSINNIVINNERFPIQLTDTADFKYFNCIAFQDKIYVSVYKDVFEYEDHSLKRVFTSKHPIISLSTDREENLWLGYLNHGAEIFKGSKKGWNPDFLQNKSITKVYQDRDNGFWFTTLESGIYYVPNFRIENYALPTSSRLKSVLSIPDTILVGDQSGNLLFYDTGTKEVLARRAYQHAVYGIFQDSFKNIWVSAGVDIIRHDRNFKIINSYPQKIATSFAQDPQGSVWTSGGIRITHFDPAGNIVQSEAPNVIYRAMLVDDSLIYLAPRTGLHLRDKKMNLLQAPSRFADYKITAIQHLNDTTLLLATQGNGLVLVNKNNWNSTIFDTSNRFLANNIYCITKTDSTVWIGTEKGIVVININNLLQHDLSYFHLSQRTGLIGDKINFILSAGEDIWAFTDNGFSVVPKSAATSASAKPIFYIKSIITDADSLTSEGQISQTQLHLPYNKNHLTLSLGYICFTNQDVFLRYRISTESQWTSTSQRTLQFLSLAPGLYLFELQYSLDNIHWNPTQAGIPFTVDSPWWLKWYTLAGAFVFIVLLAYAYFRYRQSIYTQKNHYLSIINSHQQKLIQSEIETLERERNRIARELHDGVGTNLTAIKLMVNQLLQNHRDPQAAD
ncbi:MAG: histidine kinase, partial [Chryseosolibacter sp.]